MGKALFGTGRVLATPGALEAAGGMLGLLPLLARHVRGDWGTVGAEDRQANDDALRHGARLLSAYEVNGVKFWVITEADRASTTVLLPEEY